MKRIKFFTVLSILGLFLLSTDCAFAKKPPRCNNYIENGHLFVWWNDAYHDMGEYVDGPACPC